MGLILAEGEEAKKKTHRFLSRNANDDNSKEDCVEVAREVQLQGRCNFLLPRLQDHDSSY